MCIYNIVFEEIVLDKCFLLKVRLNQRYIWVHIEQEAGIMILTVY